MSAAPLRIGLVCPYSLDVPGGVQNHVRDLAAQLRSRGHGVGVLAPGEASDELPDYVATVGRAMPIRFNGSVARLSFGPRVANRVRRWLTDGRFDVLHIHEPTVPSVSLLALWAAEVPVVATFHTAIPRSRAMSSGAAVLRPALEKITARIAVSEAARDTLVHHHGGEPVVIPNGVSCDGFAGVLPRAEWTGPGPALVFLGRTDEPRKGLAIMLAAFPEVLDRHRDARLLIAGRGDADASEALPMSARSHVTMLGQVSDIERAQLLASATVYVAPQTGGESFGIVLVEAMSAGAAVAASDLAPFRAVLEDGRLGALFAVGNPRSAANVIGDLLADTERRASMCARAAAAVRRYDWSRVVVDIEAVYDAARATAPQVARRA